MRVLALRARDTLPPSQVTYTWVPREQNKHADRLANEALDAAARGRGVVAGRQHGRAARAGRGGARRTRSRPRRGPGWWAGTPSSVRRPPRCCCATARRRTRRRSGSAGPAGRTRSCPRRGCVRRPRWPSGSRRSGGVDVVVASPMRRTRQTADAVATALGAKVREVDAFRECAFGEWEGLTFDEVRRGLAGGARRVAGRPEGRAARWRVVRRRTPAGAPRPRPAAGALPAADRARRDPRDADQGAGRRRAWAPRCRRCTGWSSRPRR